MVSICLIRSCIKAVIAIAILSAVIAGAALAQEKDNVRLLPREDARRVDVFIDGALFTSYIWPDTVKKPILFPIKTSKNMQITRGYPLAPNGGERIDHPHQVGLWFNYGDVNGVDFWNNSSQNKDSQKMGTILHKRVVQTKNGKNVGELEVEMEWVMPDGKPILQETTKFIFRAGEKERIIDRITTLKAKDKVTFNDNKEGLIGLRVARQLEHPSDKPDIFLDVDHNPAAEPVVDNRGVTGMYTNAEGVKGDKVWGTRAKWTLLSGMFGDEPVTIAMFDHPKNVGYPAYWHARGYGLFAANPLGQKAMSDGKETLNFSIKSGGSVTFKFRVLILAEAATSEKINSEYARFLSEVK